MAERIKKAEVVHEDRPVALGELIHVAVREAIETAVHEELAAVLGAARYERNGTRAGYPNGTKLRILTGPTPAGAKEWTSTLVPRYQRRLREVNEAVAATYLAGGNLRRIRGALRPLLKAAPLSKSAVSRIVATLKAGLEAWQSRSLADLDVVYLYLDAIAHLEPQNSGAAGASRTIPGSGRSGDRHDLGIAPSDQLGVDHLVLNVNVGQQTPVRGVYGPLATSARRSRTRWRKPSWMTSTSTTCATTSPHGS